MNDEMISLAYVSSGLSIRMPRLIFMTSFKSHRLKSGPVLLRRVQILLSFSFEKLIRFSAEGFELKSDHGYWRARVFAESQG